jgi:hypothetical protein
MSNVKAIRIQGELNTLALMSAPESTDPNLEGFSFGASDLIRGHNIPGDKVNLAIEAAKRINKLLATTTFPHSGLKVYFDKVQCRVEKNGYNGQINYFRYTIEGREAVSFRWFDELVAALEIFGKVTLRACRDMDA